jgi:hypothetical protein
MKIAIITFVVLSAVVGIVGVGFVGMLFMVGGGPCGETEFSTLTSPDGAYTMRHSQRGCGATTIDHELVELNGEVVFMVETHYEPYVVAWTGPRQLTVRFSKPTGETVACTRMERVDDVDIVYAPEVLAAIAVGGKVRCAQE